MAGKWDFYQCRLNGKPASIYLDMGLKKSAPRPKLHALLVVRVFLRYPDPGNGMSTDAEYEVLVAIEDQLAQALKEDVGAVYVGRITTDGRREFFFYSPGAGDFGSIARAALSAFPGYRIEAWGQADPGWKQYLAVLYPRGQSLRWITDKALIEALAARGDQGDVARPIRHVSYFPSASERAGFTGAIENAGFTVSGLPETGRAADPRPYGVAYQLSQSASLAVVSATTGLLTQLSEKNGGTYDGWECEVVGGKARPWWRFWAWKRPFPK